MTYSEESSKKGISTNSSPVSHHLSFCYYNLQPLLFSFDLGRGNPMKVWVLTVRFKLA